MSASGPNQNLTVDVGTLSGFPNTKPPTPTSGVPNFTHIFAVFIHPTMVDSKIDHPTSEVNTSTNGAGEGSVPIMQHLPATTSGENTVAGVGNLVRIISYSEQSCQIEILATGERRFLPTKMLYHPSATNHFHCSRTCPCQQDPGEVMGEEELEQHSPDTEADNDKALLTTMKGSISPKTGSLIGVSKPDIDHRQSDGENPGSRISP